MSVFVPPKTTGSDGRGLAPPAPKSVQTLDPKQLSAIPISFGIQIPELDISIPLKPGQNAQEALILHLAKEIKSLKKKVKDLEETAASSNKPGVLIVKGDQSGSE